MSKSETSEIAGGNSISPAKMVISQGKQWCFTKNNYEEEDIIDIIETFKMLKMEYIFSKEVGASGTKHLQGWCRSQKRFRPSQLKFKKDKWDKSHWEKAKGTKQQNMDYIQKEDGEVFTNLKILKKKWMSIELYDWQKSLSEVLNEEDADDRKIIWIWEAEGAAGKTTFQKYIFSKYDGVVVLGGKADDMKNGIIEYEKHNDKLPSIVLINIPRVNKGAVSIAGIESVKDMFFYSGKYEGGMVCGDPPHIMVFANEEPSLPKMSMDRWDIRYIGLG